MVKYIATTLDTTFAALSDATRRAMLARLASEGDLAVSDLAQPFRMSLPAALKHVNVLSDAGLVRREKRGRTVHCRLIAQPMRDAVAWLERYEKFWNTQLDALQAFVEDDSWQPAPPPAPPPVPATGPASPSRATSARPPSGSTRPGRKPRR